MKDKCCGCFGAANGDCDECIAKGRTKKNDTEKVYRRNAERKKSHTDTRHKKRSRRSDRKRGDGYDHGSCARERADD